MKVVDHEPHWWFLLESGEALYLDANCNHSFVGYSFLLKLDADELAKFRAEGRSFLSSLAEDIQNSAPILAISNSKYKGRDLTNQLSSQVVAAVAEWRQNQ